MEEEVSVKELLQRTVDLISDIVVPVKYADMIARPLCQVVANIEAVISAIPKEGEKTDGV